MRCGAARGTGGRDADRRWTRRRRPMDLGDFERLVERRAAEGSSGGGVRASSCRRPAARRRGCGAIPRPRPRGRGGRSRGPALRRDRRAPRPGSGVVGLGLGDVRPRQLHPSGTGAARRAIARDAHVDTGDERRLARVGFGDDDAAHACARARRRARGFRARDGRARRARARRGRRDHRGRPRRVARRRPRARSRRRARARHRSCARRRVRG